MSEVCENKTFFVCRKEVFTSMDQFKATLDKVKAYCGTLNLDELKHMEMDDFDYDKYLTSFESLGFDAKAQAHVQDLLDSLQKDVNAFRTRKTRLANGITIPKLLGRYERLPAQWRLYVRIQGLEMDDTYFEESPDTKVFEMLSSFKEKELDEGEAYDALVHLAKTLDEAEAEAAVLIK